jgi:hypothetical protein
LKRFKRSKFPPTTKMHEIVLTGESDSNVVEIYDLFTKMTKPSEIKFEYMILPNVEILSEKILLQFQNKKALIFVINSTTSSLQKSVSFFHQIMLQKIGPWRLHQMQPTTN